MYSIKFNSLVFKEADCDSLGDPGSLGIPACHKKKKKPKKAWNVRLAYSVMTSLICYIKNPTQYYICCSKY